VTLAKPNRTLSPAWGKSVGGVSERPTRADGGSDPFSATRGCKDGERHPALLDAGALRGASAKWRAWPVRRVGRSSSLVDGRTGDIGCPLERQGGERTVSSRQQSTSTRQKRHDLPLLLEGRVLHLVQRPVPANRHSTLAGIHVRGDAFETASRSCKPVKAGGTGTGAGASGRSAARRVSPLSKGRKRGTSEKEGGQGLRPCEETRVVGLDARTSEMQLQKSVGGVWSQIRSANALSKRAVRVE
jgi:hypothetical protein